MRPSSLWHPSVFLLSLAVWLALPLGPHVSAEPAIAQRAEDLFVLRLIPPSSEGFGGARTLVIQAYGPYDFAPIAGLETEILLEHDAGEVRHQRTTDARGEIVFPIVLPDGWDEDSGLDITVSATHRGVTRSVDTTLWPGSGPGVLVSTDRQLYQPSQVVHLRGLWLDGQSLPLADTEVELKIVGPEDRVMARVERRTSDLGIASFDWMIPASARSGDYTIRTDPPGWSRSQRIRIHPYEPVRLLVEARALRPFFLPGEPGEVEVRVSLPDGTPLEGARVDLASAERGSRDCCDPQHLDETRRTPTQTTDEEGRALSSFDLGPDFDDLEYRDFRDLDFEIRAHDPLTGRSETLPLTLRISRYPIHLHLLGNLRPEPLPTELWVLSQDAAGEPRAGVTVELRQVFDSGLVETLDRVVTDPHGLAALDPDFLDEDSTYQLAAFDGARLVGFEEPDLWETDEQLVLQVDRPLPAAGEPLSLTLHATLPLRRIRLELASRDRLLASRTLDRLEGSATLSFPFEPAFEGPLTLSATCLDPQIGEEEGLIDVEALVLYPGVEDRRLVLRSDRARYRPGETTHLTLEHQGGDGPSAIALAVVDRASEARQASEGLTRGPALLDGATLFAEDSGPLAMTLDPWRTRALGALDLSPPDQRQRDDTQELARALLADASPRWRDDDLNHPFHSARRDFADAVADTIRPLEHALEALRTAMDPRIVDEATLRAELVRRTIDPDTFRDPWGRPFRLEVGVEYLNRSLKVLSDGWDQKPDTRDDFDVIRVSWPFARPLGEALDKAARQLFHDRGRYLTSTDEAAMLLAEKGIDWNDEHDPWGRPYRLQWRFGQVFELLLVSAGSDGQWASQKGGGHDLTVWSVRIDPADRYRALLRSALADPSWDEGFEGDEATFRQRLENQGISLDSWLDPWGRPLYFTLGQRHHLGLGYAWDAGYDAFLTSLWTLGADGLRATDDDRQLLTQTRPRTTGSTPRPVLAAGALLSAGKGLLGGRIVLDDQFPIPGVLVVATPVGDDPAATSWSAITNEAGLYELALPAGTYWVEAKLEGFQTVVHPRVVLVAGARTELALTMTVAAEEETLVVTAESPHSVAEEPAPPVGRHMGPPALTPRLRQDFRETLFWLAEARTDAAGRLEVEIPLADSLTRWSVAALASDQRGHLATARHEIVVRQPFSIEPDLPPLLTAGDRLAVPVVANNGIEHPLDIELTVTDSDEDSGPTTTLVFEAPTGLSRHDIARSFPVPGDHGLRLVATATPTVTATATDTADATTPGDAVLKTTRVEYDGARHDAVENHLLRGASTIELDIPRAAFDNSGELEVVVYEGFEEHLVDTLDGLAKIPVGCAEQTTSTAWANLLFLDRLILEGQAGSAPGQRARRHVDTALEALGDFQRADGGFGYWRGDGMADPALTAYVVDFLLRVDEIATRPPRPTDADQDTDQDTDQDDADAPGAAEGLEVDSEQLGQAIDFLATWAEDYSLPRPDGPSNRRAWPFERLRSLRTLALVAQGLARHAESAGAETSLRAAAGALRILGEKMPEAAIQDDPYVLALRLSAHLALGEDDAVHPIVRRLERLGQRHRESLSWDLPGSTPFWAWGRSARLETTALVVRGLLEARQSLDHPESLDPMIRAGLTYLLLEKGYDGLWTSTQATLQTLRTLDLALPPRTTAGPTDVALLLDDTPLGETFRTEGEGEPRRWAVALEKGRHRLELGTGTGPTPWLLVQTRTRYVLPWTHPKAEQRSEALHFAVDCAPHELAVGEPAVCRVELRRQGLGGGMVIAEIGLPPGAEVDRTALLELKRQGIVQRYESWPGRTILYLWPGRDGIRFELPWHPRLALRGKGQPSKLYDYYNPDERVVVAPTSYRIGNMP